MNNSKNSQKKTQKNQDPQKPRDLRIPIEPLMTQCQVCEEKKADFYCSKDEVHYCQNCESQVHTPFMKKKHQEFIFKEPYIQREEINKNICDKHKKELSLFCKDDNELICTKCYETCRKNNHSILGLNEYSNEISEKIKIILNKIQIEEIKNNETIKHTLVNQNKLKQEIKELGNYIENEFNLLIEKIQNSKINYLKMLKKVEIISNTNLTKILNKKKKKKKKINKNKIQIKKLKKLEKEEKIIKLIQGSKKIIEEEENDEKKERGEREENKKKKEEENDEKNEFEWFLDLQLEKFDGILKECLEEFDPLLEEKLEEEYEEEFDPKMNYKNIIKLKNESKTAWNPSYEKYGYGEICGKKIYSSGKHEIKIKIDRFPTSENERNTIYFGVIKTENRENFIRDYDREGIYYFDASWKEIRIGILKLESRKCKIENGKWIIKNYSEEIKLKKNDIFTIFLDMNIKRIVFKINEKILEGWEKLPESVNFFVNLGYQRGQEKN
ncbi:tripartite motif-containing protein [Anaeramoeba flamelloides]|uniref:Tripartite motif-containing protein n=1 Tax=Anaeramoeba flamelloides TaxID=1746091 RepID=A0ABQ8XCE1_9EUKA|nr:tripartite motif-containing protein [Anaeramoeba flamelloides]